MGSVDQASGAYFLVSDPSGILVDKSHVLLHNYNRMLRACASGALARNSHKS
jgi:hypothetical protein